MVFSPQNHVFFISLCVIDKWTVHSHCNRMKVILWSLRVPRDLLLLMRLNQVNWLPNHIQSSLFTLLWLEATWGCCESPINERITPLMPKQFTGPEGYEGVVESLTMGGGGRGGEGGGDLKLLARSTNVLLIKIRLLCQGCVNLG